MEAHASLFRKRAVLLTTVASLIFGILLMCVGAMQARQDSASGRASQISQPSWGRVPVGLATSWSGRGKESSSPLAETGQSLPPPTVTVTPGAASISITWSSVPGGVSYDLNYYYNGAGPFNLVSGATSGGTFVQADPPYTMYNGGYYEYEVLVSDGMGHGSVGYGSAVLWLDAPTGLACHVDSSGHTILSWNAVTGAVSYAVNGGSCTPSGTSCDLGHLASNLRLTVQAVNAAGRGANSSPINTDGSPVYAGPQPSYAEDEPYCPLCELLHGAGRGDPVDLAHGWEELAPAPDITVYNPNGAGFAFTRSFGSPLASNGMSSPGLPPGWTDGYDVTVRAIPSGSASWPDLELVYPNGAAEPFSPTLSSGSPTGAFSHPTGAPYMVTGSPGTGGNWNSITIAWSNGASWVFAPSAPGEYALSAVLNRVGQGVSFAYDGGRRITAVSDYSTSSPLASLSYDYYGYLSEIDDAYGRSVYYVNGLSSFGSPDLLQVSQITPTSAGPSGASNLETYDYVAAGGPQLYTVTVPSPTGLGTATATLGYDGTGKLASVTDGNGNHYIFTYGSGSTLVKMEEPGGTVDLSYAVSFDSMGRQTGVQDAASNTQSWAYADAANPYQVTTYTDEDSQPTSFTYDGFGNLTSTTDPLSVTTNLTYDYSHFALGRLTQVQTGGLTPVSFTYYEPSGLLDTLTTPQPGGGGTVTSSYVFDVLGNLTSVTVPGSGSYSTRTVSLNYTTDGGYSQPDSVGQPLTITDPGGHVEHFRYDAQGRALSETDALGYETDFLYNLAGQVTTTTYPATGQTGSGRSYVLDSYLYVGGFPLAQALYNESGALVKTVATSYDQEGEVLSTSGTTDAAQFTYDAAYRVLTAKDGNGGITAYSYDSVGNLAAEELPGGDTFTFPSYDPAHHLLQQVDANLVTTNYTYTSAGKLPYSIDAPSDPSVHATFGYDTYGRLNSVVDANGVRTASYDDAGNVTGEVTTYSGIPAQTIAYGFFPDGTRASMTTPAGTFTYDYDATGRPASVTNPYSETTLWTYTDRGDMLKQTQSNGATASYAHNPLGLVTNVNLGGIHHAGLVFGGIQYDGADDVLGASLTTTIPWTYSPGFVTYSYDGLQRLTQETSTYLGYSLNHGYDSNSNLTTFRGSTLSYNGKGELSGTGYAFDANGNPTTYNGSSLTFDADDRLTAYGSALTMGYRADGLRAWKQSSGAKTYFLYDGDTLLCELDSSGNVVRTYTNGADGLVSSNTSSGSIFYAFDFRGATVQRLNSSGYQVSGHWSDAYGADLFPQADPCSGFGSQFGYYHDSETGLVYLQNRYYDPATGRFLNRDPIGLSGGMNRYGFVSGNPVSGADPNGLDGLNLFGLEFNGDTILDGLNTYANAARKLVGANYDRATEVNPGFEFSYYSAAVGREAAEWVLGAKVIDLVRPVLIARRLRLLTKAARGAELTEGQSRALDASPCLREAYEGERVHTKVFKAVNESGWLTKVLRVKQTARFQRGPDFFINNLLGGRPWFDITTEGQWARHVARYGPGGTRIPY